LGANIPSLTEGIAVGQPGMCGGVTRVALDGFLETAHRPPDALDAAPIPEVAPAQVCIVGVGVDGGGMPRRRTLGDRHSDRNFVGDRARDLGLKRQDVAQVAVVAPGPKVVLLRGIDQSHRDAHAALIAPDAAVEKIFDPQFARDHAESFWRQAA
jgi:hypothetical protein